MQWGDIVKFLSLNWDALLIAVQGILMGVIAISIMIPGDQPEKFLQSIVDFVSKFSKKKKEE